MPDRLVILWLDPKDRLSAYGDVLEGMEINSRTIPEANSTPSYYRVTLTKASHTKLNQWAKEKGLPCFYRMSFWAHMTLGYPDTPELLAYDEIDQQEDKPAPKKRLRTKKTPALAASNPPSRLHKLRHH